MSRSGIAPGLLLAMPQLLDPNFARSVVLMIEHGEDHSFGLVVNRTTEFRASDVLESMGIHWGADAGEVVWSGGPVMPNSGWLLHDDLARAENEGTYPLTGELALSTSPEELRAVVEAPTGSLRFLMGYAGWGAGQLEGELAQGAWLVADATRRLVFETEPERMWQAALESIGVDPSSLFTASGVH
ncbi:MAG: YqgE/AlgH family protein [Proteobacteria bacterium]|nr:YqgE/AlgH family protein [Pseudomonadota bacterium]